LVRGAVYCDVTGVTGEKKGLQSKRTTAWPVHEENNQKDNLKLNRKNLLLLLLLLLLILVLLILLLLLLLILVLLILLLLLIVF